jgi:hypothetical protein
MFGGCFLESNCVWFLKVWRLGGVGVGAREVDAAFNARDRDL